jgi:hypothetical protein
MGVGIGVGISLCVIIFILTICCLQIQKKCSTWLLLRRARRVTSNNETSQAHIELGDIVSQSCRVAPQTPKPPTLPPRPQIAEIDHFEESEFCGAPQVSGVKKTLEKQAPPIPLRQFEKFEIEEEENLVSQKYLINLLFNNKNHSSNNQLYVNKK